ncbi:MAG: FAD-dependent oxidoreductase [Desulfobacterales bacterium]|nr:FAD-dependent oxidoreductase [Desulfobacterales bacterium]
MAKQQDNVEIKETLYDTVIIGGGIAGLTAAYMLRDKNILVLESEERFGGRVWSEKVHEATNNIGTQFFEVEDTSFHDLVKELGVKYITHDPSDGALGFYMNNKFYPDVLNEIFTTRVKLSALKLLSTAYRKVKIYKLGLTNPNDPRYLKLVAKTVDQLQGGYNPDLMALVNTYMRGACVAKASRTSAGMGMLLTLDIFKTGKFGFVKGGFQQITDAMVNKLDGKVMSGASVTRVEENDGIVTIHYKKDGQEHVIKSKSAIMGVSPEATLNIMPKLPEWKKEAFSKVAVSPFVFVSVYLKRDIPWKRIRNILFQDTIFQGLTDQTLGTEDDKNEDNPIIYNFIISVAPDEKEAIKEFLAKSDEEILSLTLKDFKRVRQDVADIEKYITGTKVTRFPVGEIEVSPEYILEMLPELPKPVGNIHFVGDYTELRNFVDGAAYSGMRAARALGSKYVCSKEEEKQFPKEEKCLPLRWTTIILNILLIAGGFFLPRGYGATMSIGAGVLLALTAAFPSFLPPNKLVYKVLLGITIGFGGVIGLLANFLG